MQKVRAHGIWFDLGPAISGKNNHAILEECARGEKEALDDYNRILKKANMPINVREVWQKQYDFMASDLDKLQNI